MKEFDPVREFIFDYITVVAENTLAIAVIGSIFVRDASISFVYFFLPFVLALICMIPCIPISEGRYDRKADITAKRNRTCGIGSRNVSCHPFRDGGIIP